MHTIRDCAQAIIASIDAHEGSEAFGAAIETALSELIAHPDLVSQGVPRQGNNVAASWYLYYDGELSILLFHVPKDTTIPPHDHGIWETLSVYRGRLQHRVYERADDGETPGTAELRVIDDRVLERGDFAIVTPPADIHGFTALSDDTYAITVVNGAYKEDRHYYQPEQKTYVVRPPRNPH